MMTTATLAEMAREVMAAHPCESGWQRVESKPCRGTHPKPPVASPGTVLWRRRPDIFEPKTYRLLDASEDPQLVVAESVSHSLCVTDLFVYMNRVVLQDLAHVHSPWSFSDGDLGPGMTLRLTTANGEWVWVVVGEPSPCCGGYTARWAD